MERCLIWKVFCTVIDLIEKCIEEGSIIGVGKQEWETDAFFWPILIQEPLYSCFYKVNEECDNDTERSQDMDGSYWLQVITILKKLNQN